MSTLYYDIPIEFRNEDYKVINTNFPAEWKNAIKNYLPKQWAECHIESTFDGIIKNKIQSCPMTIIRKSDGGLKARITVNFVPGFRLNKTKREECFSQLDGQMSDGFGESYDGRSIPGIPDQWVLYF